MIASLELRNDAGLFPTVFDSPLNHPQFSYHLDSLVRLYIEQKSMGDYTQLAVIDYFAALQQSLTRRCIECKASCYVGSFHLHRGLKIGTSSHG